VRSYSNFSLRDLLDAFASSVPAPGGGSAAALTGTTAVSLLVMAASVRLSRPKPPESGDLADAADRLRSLRPAMAALIDRDAESYSSVVAALRLPVTDSESEARQRSAYDTAMRAATEAPLETMRASRRAIGDAAVVAAYCTRSARADVGVAIALLRAAVSGAGITVDANLGMLNDVEYISAMTAERRRLQAESEADAERALRELARRA
jgi:formiminotetrahydrofolate cyclodeaminase